jgi:hypothetical protein
VYVVPVRINRAITLHFIVDSGAADVNIPFDVALTLARAGTISDSDFIGDQAYRIGDGSTLRNKRFMLRELTDALPATPIKSPRASYSELLRAFPRVVSRRICCSSG